MFSFNFLASIYLSVLCANSVLAHPLSASVKHDTHRTRFDGRGFQLETYHPKSTYETFNGGVEHSLTKRADATVEDSAAAWASKNLGMKAGDYRIRTSSSAELATHVYMRQQLNGIDMANAVANIALNKENKVIACGSSFMKPSKVASATPSVDLDTAIKAAEERLGGKHNGHPATLEYLARDDDTAALTHVVQIKDDKTSLWVEAFVDAHSGDVLSVTDFYTHAAYRVLPITKEIPAEGYEDLVDPEDKLASPNGWHTVAGKTSTTTSGNNAVSFKTSASAVTKESAPGQFFYNQSDAKAPTQADNLNAARVNTFFVVNTMHDITYRYGFTEKAFNFQQENLVAGGKARDRVTISVQDASGTNNANFATPADGQSGQMRMFTWTFTDPNLDGAFENDIVIHEFTHGVTNRMTGGGTGRCLQTTEAGGMGEGWSDAMANWIHQQSANTTDFIMGQYVTADPKGIRQFPYSTDAKVNPLRFSSVKQLNEVHNIGEVWANMLHQVYAALVDEHGFEADAKTNPDSTAGNAVFMHLFLDSLQLQPCNPTFVSARDAWIEADANRFQGENKCTIAKAFASRGLGQGAKNFVDSSKLPAGC